MLFLTPKNDDNEKNDHLMVVSLKLNKGSIQDRIAANIIQQNLQHYGTKKEVLVTALIAMQYNKESDGDFSEYVNGIIKQEINIKNGKNGID